jgi:PAS domain-containing protein
MFNTLPISELDQLLGQFSVPMFVIERRACGQDFHMVALNAALEELAEQPRSEIIGRSISEIAPLGMPDDAHEHYMKCVTSKTTVHFAYVFLHQDREVRWNTTLQYAQSPEASDRVIATAIQVPQERALLQDRLAFEDVRYYSSIADLQLENLNNAFSSVSQEAHVTPIDEERIMRLHAVCCTIQRSVADIKDIVKRAQVRHAKQAAQGNAIATGEPHRVCSSQSMGTVRALVNASAVDPRWTNR